MLLHSSQTAGPVSFKGVGCESCAKSGVVNCRLSLSLSRKSSNASFKAQLLVERNKGHRQKVEPRREEMPPKRQVQKANLEMCSCSGPSCSFSHSLLVSCSVFPSAAVCQMVAVLSVHSSDKPVGVAVRENGWSKAPPLSSICAPPAS